MSEPDPAGIAVPVTILTGFLGSGKTTLLNRLLKQPSMAGAAVIVNEFGEIGLDHLLIEASEEQFQLLDNGCVCCTVRGDLVETLKTLHRRAVGGELPELSRVVIETTGLADPAPILHTLIAEQDLASRYRIAGVVTTVDAVNGPATLERHAEAAKQVAVADRLIITKADLVDGWKVEALQHRLAALAPAAERCLVADAALETLLDAETLGDARADRIAAWFDKAIQSVHDHEHECGPHCEHHDHDHHHEGHGLHHGIQSYSFVIDRPVEWTTFATWLDYIAALKGEDLLRLKGLVCVADDIDRPLVLHGVQHVFHPPTRLDTWPSPDRRTRLVFIVRDIARETIERTLAKFAGVRPAQASERHAA
ncbi:MAG: GTP-binding protein [Aquamicrobium sp.]|uniref:CobW family GTP-binding protein n=1 Tax=Mesorhizobium sp. Pch-S TaxID=2082387 RepID=UPI0010130DF4|nr:GTP-binding protein [Mesorhizobium sp. Pch-S]MBR2692435.1 GTP-binding protein [Aquamicrobium sp.]QAZ46217.1 GTP-binding protein [Mesorhizobium sp. Pch-S]